MLAEGASRPANDLPPATVMPFDPYREAHLLQERIRRAQMLTPALAAEVIARACPRLQARHPTAKAKLVRLIESDAFADAMLALLELELPQWKLRRLVCEDGEWHCSLSKQLGLPAELDDMAERSTKACRWRSWAHSSKQGVTVAAQRRPAPVRAAGSAHGRVCALLRRFRVSRRTRAQ